MEFRSWILSEIVDTKIGPALSLYFFELSITYLACRIADRFGYILVFYLISAFFFEWRCRLNPP